MTDKEAKAILIDKVKPCLNGTEWEMALDIAIKALEQEPKTGRWKPNFRYGMYPGEEHFICSECNGQSMKQSKYCPECGARMVEPQESGGKK